MDITGRCCFCAKAKENPSFFCEHVEYYPHFLYIIVVGGRFHGEKIFET